MTEFTLPWCGAPAAEDSRAATDPPRRWYALNVLGNRVFDLRDWLCGQSVETYVPVERVVRHTLQGCDVTFERPAVSRLMFMRVEPQPALSYERTSPVPFRIYRRPDSNPSGRIIQPVPDAEMQLFMFVTSMSDSGLEYLATPPPNLHAGQHVRVTGGVFAGAEGYIKRIRGNRRFVVELRGICLVAAPYIPSCYLEPID